MTPEQLHKWACGIYDREYRYPTIARAAKRFSVKQEDIEDAIESYQGSGYLNLAVALQAGNGVYSLEGGSRLVEAY